MTKILDGAELAGYLKEKQARTVRRLRAQKKWPKLVIIRDNDSPVIEKYVTLKKSYGEDIRVAVEDWHSSRIGELILQANSDRSVHGMIVQLPLRDQNQLAFLSNISPQKDVDGLTSTPFYYTAVDFNKGNAAGASVASYFDSATATAINWLLAGYGVDLQGKRIAIVGYGKLVGAPLAEMWRNSHLDVTVFDKGDDLGELVKYDVVVSATGAPHLIKPDMIKGGAIVVDAGTASEDGVLVGDLDDSVRKRQDLVAITPKIGGVGPMTVAMLFEHVLMAAELDAE